MSEIDTTNTGKKIPISGKSNYKSPPSKSLKIDSSNSSEDSKEPVAKGPDPKSPSLKFLSDDWDGILLIKSDEDIYRLKQHNYKEIKHYIKGEVLGRGKFGVVREFIDKKTLKRYAGKIIRRGILRRNLHLRNQVNKELAITYHFDHRNVLRVYDLYATMEKIYMFMEFCYGELAEFFQVYERLPKSQSKDYFTQIIEGLDYLHSHGIIHRDIKPENILVTPDHVLKLADFGVCQEVSLFSNEDTVFGCDGTPLFHPPELFDSKIIFYSGSKIDIWAASCILFKMLTGEYPFFNKPEATKDDIQHILDDNIQYPQCIKDDVLCVDLMNKVFEKNFTKRIGILEIRNHAWMQTDYNIKKNEIYLKLPMDEDRQMDNYRGLTVLTRIYNKYYPPSDKDKLVNFKQFQDSCKLMPLQRASRYLETIKRENFKRKQFKLNFI